MFTVSTNGSKSLSVYDCKVEAMDNASAFVARTGGTATVMNCETGGRIEFRLTDDVVQYRVIK